MTLDSTKSQEALVLELEHSEALLTFKDTIQEQMNYEYQRDLYEMLCRILNAFDYIGRDIRNPIIWRRQFSDMPFGFEPLVKSFNQRLDIDYDKIADSFLQQLDEESQATFEHLCVHSNCDDKFVQDLHENTMHFFREIIKAHYKHYDKTANKND